MTLGVSRVENDPALRAFNFMIAVEVDEGAVMEGLETCRAPASADL